MEETKVVDKKSEATNSTSKKNNNKSKDTVIDKIAHFFKGVKAEFGKIIWPTKNDIIKQTTAVVIVSVICCALIAALDYGFEFGMNFLTSIFK